MVRIVILLVVFLGCILRLEAQQLVLSRESFDLAQLEAAAGKSSPLFQTSYLKPGQDIRDRSLYHIITLKIAPGIRQGLESGFTLHMVVELDTGDVVKLEKRELNIVYKAKEIYQSKDGFAKQGLNISKCYIRSFSFTDLSGQGIQVAANIKDQVILEEELKCERYFKPETTLPVSGQQVVLSTDKGFARLSWSKVQWATAYDLEYSFIDNYNGKPGNGSAADTTAYNFRFNSARVQLKDNSYEVPLVYESGFLVFRVRPVGIWGAGLDKVINGKWSVGESGSTLVGESVGAKGFFYLALNTPETIHEKDQKNWQYQASFSEDGKRKDLVTYLDGTLRSRQTVTTLNTQGNLVAGETIYDNNGRPAIEMLAAPVIDLGQLQVHVPVIKYQDKLNRNLKNSSYTWKDFDLDMGCMPNPSPFSTTSGAPQYYSDANLLLKKSPDAAVKKQMAYIADAGGFPFSQVEYMPDKSGRIKRQGQPGPAFKLGDGTATSHELKFYYGTPAQEELDRVFGNDIGSANHYSKEVKVDENGQAYVTIKNAAGKVVATALSGRKPDNVSSIDEPVNSKDITVNLAKDFNVIDQASNTLSLTFPLIVTENTMLRFSYRLFSEGFNYGICGAMNGLCYDCVYDLSMHITDECGKVIDSIVEPIGTLDELRKCKGADDGFFRKDSVLLKIGSYLITKKLSVNENAINKYVSDYLADNCWMGLISNYKGKGCPGSLPIRLCNAPAKDCHFDSVTLIRTPHMLYLPQPTPWKQTNGENCTTDTSKGFLSVQLQRMLSDVSPGGQYAEYLGSEPPGGPSVISGYPVSVLNGNNHLPSRGNWKYPVFHYRNEDGSEMMIEKNDNGSLISVKPEDLQLDEFIHHWKRSMAYSLLPYHPEYCYYEWSMKNKDLYDYEQKLLDMQTYKQATGGFELWLKEPCKIENNNDPLFNRDKSLAPKLRGYLNNLKVLNPGENKPPSGVAVSACQLAELAAAGFSSTVDPALAEQYLNNHNIFKNADRADKEWIAFRTLYLLARTRIIDSIRTINLGSCCDINSYIGNAKCEDGISGPYCILFKNKIPVFGDQQKITDLVRNELDQTIDNSDPTNTCRFCAQPQGLLEFLNIVTLKKKSKGKFPLVADTLSLIANSTTDSIIANGGSISWLVNPVANGVGGSLVNEKDSLLCAISAVALKPGFNTDSVKGFSCLKNVPGQTGGFTMIAAGNLKDTMFLKGITDCLEIKDCTGPPVFVQEQLLSEYTGEFVNMLQRALMTAKSGKINQQILFGRDPASDAFSNGRDPVHLWNLLSDVSTSGPSFSIPLSFSTDGKQDEQVTIDGPSIGFFKTFSNWRITGYKLVTADEHKDTCKNYKTLEVSLQNLTDASLSSFTVSCKKLVFGRSCERNNNNSLCCMIQMPDWPSKNLPDCDSLQRLRYRDSAVHAVENLKKYLSDSLRQAYIKHCLHPIEAFILNYEENTYHYTLSYYDQAGNLIKTIPPKGVKILTEDKLDSAALFRSTNNNKPIVPQHSMQTVYSYNTLNALVSTSSPDGGTNNFCYDELGRTVYKQNAVQAANPAYTSATFIYYDSLGRIVQTGQVPVNGSGLPHKIKYSEFTAQLDLSNKFKVDVFTTFYDRLPERIQGGFDLNIETINLNNLRNRVTGSFYHRSFMDNTPYSHAFFYSYDIAGNMDTLLQDFRSLDNYGMRLNFCGSGLFNRVKKVAYRYDLLSKKVSQVWYQPGRVDQFIHRYEYDADNRLLSVRTGSRIWEDNKTMDEDAVYNYYPHGPLARMELGEEKIQAINYAYTIRGWVKGINTGMLKTGLDADTKNEFPPGAAAYSLIYFGGDYKAIGGPGFAQDVEKTKLATGFSRDMFNGNIRSMITENDAFNSEGRIQATGYSYDLLNRLVASKEFHPADNTQAAWSNGDFTEAYKTLYSYDANGNIKSLFRNNEVAKTMDNLNNNYPFDNNRLSEVKDDAGKVNPQVNDLDVQSGYEYDAAGRLVKQYEGTVKPERIEFTWTAFERLRNVFKNTKNIEYSYNALLEKGLEYNELTKTATYYVRDLQGNPLAIYSFTPRGGRLEELPIYGSSRIGIYRVDTGLLTLPLPDKIQYNRGSKAYEINNHLGNVLATVSDRKIQNGTRWKAEILFARDYYPFGMIMPGRDSVKARYRYGFNSKESLSQVKGEGNVLDFGARLLDARIGRTFSIDPKALLYPGIGPYVYTLDNPLNAIDPEGKLVVFVNGFRPALPYQNAWRFFTKKEEVFSTDKLNYWEGVDKRFSERLNDSKAVYADGDAPAQTAKTMAGFNYRVKSGEEAGRDLVAKINSGEIQLQKNDKGEIIEKITVVSHSMGYAHSLGMINELEKAGLKVDATYNLAPENPSAGDKPSNVNRAVQYGSGVNQPWYSSDWIAPQVDNSTMEQAHIPEKNSSGEKIPVGPYQSHNVKNYQRWIFDIKPGQPGYVGSSKTDTTKPVQDRLP